MPTWLPWLIISTFTGLRLVVLLIQEPIVLDHDGAYIVLVAQNLLDGQGYVNDAHWLVFLLPDSLPMPFHNANPLYITLIAGLSWLTGLSVVNSGFAVLILAQGFLWAGLLVLAGKYVKAPAQNFLIASAGVFFSPVFEDSLRMSPDPLCAAFTVWFLVFLVRTERLGSLIAAGAFLGLAWLTRSSAQLIVPAVFVYLCMTRGWRKAIRNLAAVGVTALVVISPWLIHTAIVWGNPLRSDASYYLMQDYHARNFDGSVERLWHSTQTPPGLGELRRREPGAVIGFYLRNAPRFVKNTLAGWSHGSYVLAGTLVLLTLLVSFRTWQRFRKNPEKRGALRPEIVGGLVYAATLVLLFNLRAETLEIRYLALVSLFLAMFLMAGAIQAWHDLEGEKRLLAAIVLVLSAAIWLGFVPVRNVLLWQGRTDMVETRTLYFDLARQVHEKFGRQGPMVVGDYPYFYTLATAAPSLSIPESDDDFLLWYMKKYGAHCVLLTRTEVEFWRPKWLEKDGLPPWLEQAQVIGTAIVYQRK